MKKYIPQQEHFDSFTKLVNAASTKYNLSFKDACRALKCSRAWAQTYIRPNVPCIYISNGKGTGGPNYARLLSMAVSSLNGPEETSYSCESVYIDGQAFNELIRGSITSCKKRAKSIPRTYFVKKTKILNYYIELLELYIQLSQLSEINAPSHQYKDILNRANTLYLKYADNIYVESIIQPATVFQTKRTEAEFVDVPIPDTPVEEWMAVHDLMDYGDIEETIYRQLFRAGCIRVELKLPDKNGEVKDSGKVYYIKDPQPVNSISISQTESEYILSKFKTDSTTYSIAKEQLDRIPSADRFIIRQSAWLRYNSILGRNTTY